MIVFFYYFNTIILVKNFLKKLFFPLFNEYPLQAQKYINNIIYNWFILIYSQSFLRIFSPKKAK